MLGSEDEYGDMGRLHHDSSQTLPNGQFHPGIDEDELPEYQMPKQIPLGGNFMGRALDSSKATIDEGGSYKSINENARQIAFSSKNMKDSFETKFDNSRFELNSLQNQGGQGQRNRDGVSKNSLVKSPSELATKYEQRLVGPSTLMQLTEKNTKMASSQIQGVDQHMHLINEFSLESNQISRIEMATDKTNYLQKKSVEDTYYTETDQDTNKSRSRSNPRGNELIQNIQVGDKIGSPNYNHIQVIDDEEITERIRQKGERLIQKPEIIHNQTYKQIERAMQDYNEKKDKNRRNDSKQANGSFAPTQIMGSNERKTSGRNDSVSRRQSYNNYGSREVSNGRDENGNSNRTEIFDGSFGRKKRVDSVARNANFKIDPQPLFKDNNEPQRVFEKRNSRFTSQKDQFMGIGSGIPLSTFEKSQNFNQAEGFRDVFKTRESKSIPRESFGYDHINKQSHDRNNDQKFSDIVKNSNVRRTCSTSPYGGPRNNMTSSYRNDEQQQAFNPSFSNQKYNHKFSKTDNNFNNLNHKPFDDIYKQQENKRQSMQIDQKLDKDQFQHCQDLLQKAKDRRLNMNLNSQNKVPMTNTSSDTFISRRASGLQDKVNFPDVKSLQTRYDYLMETIKEKESEGTITGSRAENSLTKSENERRRQAATVAGAHIKTMKWKKSEKSLEAMTRDGNDVLSNKYASKPLRNSKVQQNTNQKSNITSTYEWLMNKHDSAASYSFDSNIKQPGLNEQKHQAISFGLIQDLGSVDSLQNPGFIGSRKNSQGRIPMPEIDQATLGITTQKKYQPDLSHYSRDLSNNSNERSFYKPMSPEKEFNNRANSNITNQSRKIYNPVNQVRSSLNGHQPPTESSLEREKISVPSSFEYQSRIFGTQPQAQKKFQIERRNYDDLNKSSHFGVEESTYASKLCEAGLNNTNQQIQKNIPANGPAISSKTGSALVSSSIMGTTTPQLSINTSMPYHLTGNSVSNTNSQHQISITQPIITGHIGKIQRKGQNQEDSTQVLQPIASIQTTRIQKVDLGDHRFNSTNEQLKNLQQTENQVVGQGLISNICLESQNSAQYTQPRYPNLPNLQSTDAISQSIRTGQSLMTPKSNSQAISQALSPLPNIFQRLDKSQAQFRSFMPNQADGDEEQNGYKQIFFAKYIPSYQLKQFNADFIDDLVQHIENIQNHFAENTRKNILSGGTQKHDNGLTSLDFNKDDQNSYQEIGQHLKSQYDTSKDPNTWVPQLYADMCKARKIATQNEECFKKEKEKNDELMNQIETLERDLLSFRKDIISMENSQNNDTIEVNQRLRDQKEVEIEWIERIDALLTTQKFYSDGQAPTCLPDSDYDIDTFNTKKVFSKLLNKLEVLLCHQQLEKSKANKFMLTTVKKMDSRITQISDKFSKIQKKIVETCSFDGSEMNESQHIQSHRTSTISDNSNDCPTMKGTMEMLKKIKKDRDEQERIIDQLKQIIQIQDKIYKADNEKLDANLRDHVMKNIESFVTEEHKKPPKNMKLEWVTTVQNIQIRQPDFRENNVHRKSHSELYQDRSHMLNDYADDTTTNNNCEEIQGLSPISMQQNDKPKQSSKKLVTCEVQTDLNDVSSNSKRIQSTKVYKEITVQTDPVKIKSISQIQHDETKSDISLSKKSSTTTERRDKQLHTFKEGLQQNMNEIVQEQLSKHLQINMSEIAQIKHENGRLIEKYKFEQKQTIKLKEEVRQKQKYERFFEKQRAKKYRNCGCQIGASQLQYMYDDQYSSSYNQRSITNTSLAIKSIQHQQSRRFNKENHRGKTEAGNLILRNQKKQQFPSAALRSPEDPMLKSSTDFASLNTLALQQKYCVPDSSNEEKTPSANIVGEFNRTRGQSLAYNQSGDYSKSVSIIEESQNVLEKEEPPVSSNNTVEANQQEKQLLSYHIKKNQELHDLLRACLVKFEDGGQSSSKQDTQQLLQLLQHPQSNTLAQEDSDTINQKHNQVITYKENEDQAAVSVLASSANFGNREHAKDMKSVMNSIEKKKPSQYAGTSSQHQVSRGGNEFTLSKKEQDQTRRQAIEDASYKILMGNQQSFGDEIDLHAAILQNFNRSNSGQQQPLNGGFGQNLNQIQSIDNHPYANMNCSKTEILSMEDQERKDQDDYDDISDNIDVSEQIKQIEGRQKLLFSEIIQSSSQTKHINSKEQI